MRYSYRLVSSGWYSKAVFKFESHFHKILMGMIDGWCQNYQKMGDNPSLSFIFELNISECKLMRKFNTTGFGKFRSTCQTCEIMKWLWIIERKMFGYRKKRVDSSLISSFSFFFFYPLFDHSQLKLITRESMLWQLGDLCLPVNRWGIKFRK